MQMPLSQDDTGLLLVTDLSSLSAMSIWRQLSVLRPLSLGKLPACVASRPEPVGLHLQASL
jgi:hypothetical protein